MHNLEQGQLMNKDYFDSIISADNQSGKKCWFQVDFRCVSDEQIVWKVLKMLHLNYSILTFSTYLSGNTVLPQASGFQKLDKIDYFGILINFCPLKR